MDKVNEQWRPIKGFDGLYEVSNLGNVRNKRGKVLSPKVGKTGYLIVGLHDNCEVTYKYIHRLVGETFLEIPDFKCEINHIDENKSNNRVDNLEWTTRVQNVNHGTGRSRHDRKLFKPVSCFLPDGTFVKRYESITEAGRDLGVLKTSVWAAVSGKSKTCKGMIWKYD